MATLIFVTITSILINYSIADNDDENLGPDMSLYFYGDPNVINIDWFYDPVVVNVSNIICLIICGFYALLVGVILTFQTGNFCLNKTTSERFSSKKRARVSSLSETKEDREKYQRPSLHDEKSRTSEYLNESRR